MTRKWVAATGSLVSLLVMVGLSSRPATAQAAQQTQEQKPSYTIAEYNAFQACRGEKDPQARLKLLDDFVAKFPNSTLMQYIDQFYFDTYGQLKNYPKVIEYADKLLALGDKLPLEARINIAYTRSATFPVIFNPKDSNAATEISSARTAADLGLKLLGGWQKPQNLTDDQYNQQKKLAATTFYNAAGFAALQQKDYKAAVDYFKGSLGNTPNDPITYYRLGLSYLLQDPPQNMDGFWALARSIALKGPGEAQVRDYLKKRLLNYQQPGCDNLIDSQMNELIQLATTSPDRPANYTIPSADDLTKVRQSSTILTVLADLKGGGDKAKLTWLALCGSEFPEVVGKIIDVTSDADAVDFKVFTGATEDEMQAATTPNMDVKVSGQPEVSRLQKDDGIRFSGTLASYDPEPFALHWDKVKVDPTIIPEEKPAAGKPRRRIPPKKPPQP